MDKTKKAPAKKTNKDDDLAPKAEDMTFGGSQGIEDQLEMVLGGGDQQNFDGGYEEKRGHNVIRNLLQYSTHSY